MNAPAPRRSPTTQVPKAFAMEAAPKAPTGAGPLPADPRKASEVRRPTTAVPIRPQSDPSASRPAAPSVKAPTATAIEEEDPEKLLREYAERQKTKLVRLEQQLVEYKKIVSERDAWRAKAEALSREVQEAKKQLEAAAKADEVIKDLQGKVDAAILSNSLLAEDKEKLKKGLAQQTENLKKAEDRAAIAEKSLAETESRLAEQAQGRELAEVRVRAALEALQGNPPSTRPAAADPGAARPVPLQKPMSEVPTRAIPATPTKTVDEKAATAPEGVTARPTPAKVAPAQRPPGRFSFLKK